MASIVDYLTTARGELEEEGALPDDPDAAADALTARVRSNTAHLSNPPKPASVRRAAAKETGAEPIPTPAQQDRILEEEAERRSPRGRARRARQAATPAGRALTRLGRRARRRTRSPFRVARSATGVIGAMFGLIVLYWLLRTASRTEGAKFLENVVSGARRPFAWLFSTGGVAAGNAPAPGSANFPSSAPELQGPPSTTQTERVTPQEVNGVDIVPYVGRWQYLVERYFPASEIDKAMRVMYCESRGNPDATNESSGAGGLFQHLPQYWSSRSQAAGFAGASVYNAEANVATAAWLLTRQGWGAWPNCGKL